MASSNQNKGKAVEPPPVSKEVQENIVDGFINHLLKELNKAGVDTSNWDGEELPEEIIASNVCQIIGDLKDEIAELKKSFPASPERDSRIASEAWDACFLRQMQEFDNSEHGVSVTAPDKDEYLKSINLK